MIRPDRSSSEDDVPYNREPLLKVQLHYLWKHLCSAPTAPDVRRSTRAHTRVKPHVTYVLPVIDRGSNDQHQSAIDVLSLALLLMLSPDGATGLLCICVRLRGRSRAYLCLIFRV